MMTKFFIFFILFLAYITYKIKVSFDPPPLPPRLEEIWWGPGKPGSVKSLVKPFKIDVPESILTDLQYRLKHHSSFTPPLEGVQQQYGINTNLLKEVVNYWKTKYNWRSREKFLNKFLQYTVNIQGLDIHYIHVKPKVSKDVKILPLLLLHGWPGSVREFYEIIPLLTTLQDGRDFVFEVIAPHIPGFGFSKPAVKPGLSPDHIALVFKNMMEHLGFTKFYAQGGDFGHIILQNMAVLYPESVIGYHSNMCVLTNMLSNIKLILASIYPSFPKWYVRPEHYNRIFPIKDYFVARIRETGYLHLQSTKPDTLGVAINDSPVGLAAYILEKFTTGTNKTWQNREDGGLLEYFTYDDLLDNIMYYWVTSSATTSFRLYSETFNSQYMAKGILSQPSKVPTACVRFSYDFFTPDGILKDVYTNLVQLSDYEGGHFAAMQLPKVLAGDIYKAVPLFQKANKK